MHSSSLSDVFTLFVCVFDQLPVLKVDNLLSIYCSIYYYFLLLQYVTVLLSPHQQKVPPFLL